MTKKYKDSSFDQGDHLFSREILFEVEIVYKVDLWNLSYVTYSHPEILWNKKRPAFDYILTLIAALHSFLIYPVF